MELDAWVTAALPKDRPLKVRLGPRRRDCCAIRLCPVDEHSYVVTLPQLGHGIACAGCAEDRGFKLDWSGV